MPVAPEDGGAETAPSTTDRAACTGNSSARRRSSTASLRNVFGAIGVLGRNLARGQTNFARMLWKFGSVYNVRRQLADHRRSVEYELPPPEHRATPPGRQDLFIHSRALSRPPLRTDPEPETS